jgi:hypothetical protein
MIVVGAEVFGAAQLPEGQARTAQWITNRIARNSGRLRNRPFRPDGRREEQAAMFHKTVVNDICSLEK